MRLKVIKRFKDKENSGEILEINSLLESEDLDRINVLVGRGFCEIESLQSDSEEEEQDTNAENEDMTKERTSARGRKKKQVDE